MGLLQNTKTKASALEIQKPTYLKIMQQKAGIFIFLIWAGAAVIGALLFMAMQPPPKTEAFFYDGDKLSLNNGPASSTLNKRIKKQSEDAFVFVHINNKFIITRYPTHQKPENPEDSENPLSASPSYPLVRNSTTTTPTVIVRRVKPTLKNKAEDFSIKPTPQ